MKHCLAVLLLIWCVAAASEPLSADEQRMADWIDANTDGAIALLKETVDIPSGSMNFDGVRAVGRVMQRELDAIGLDTEWIEMPAEVNRAGHLFARKDGRGKKFVLIGHLDTVFESDDGIKPFSRDGDIATGHGIYDMKTGTVFFSDIIGFNSK